MNLTDPGSISQIAAIPVREHIGKTGGAHGSMVAGPVLPAVMIR